MSRRSTSVLAPSKSQAQSHDRDERIRSRAYALYEERGRTDGHEVDDWLQAEAEVGGKSRTTAA